MDKNQSSPSIADDVLHNPEHSRLTPEEIAKAIAHHKKNHPNGNPQNSSPKQGDGKKQGEKPKQ
jgi:hypothetical protein